MGSKAQCFAVGLPDIAEPGRFDSSAWEWGACEQATTETNAAQTKMLAWVRAIEMAGFCERIASGVFLVRKPGAFNGNAGSGGNPETVPGWHLARVVARQPIGGFWMSTLISPRS